jgi:signal transduction histidine kinase
MFLLPLLCGAAIALWQLPDYGSIKAFEQHDITWRSSATDKINQAVIAPDRDQAKPDQAIFIAGYAGVLDIRSDGRVLPNLLDADGATLNRYYRHYAARFSRSESLTLIGTENLTRHRMLDVYVGPDTLLSPVYKQQAHRLRLAHQLPLFVLSFALLTSIFLIFFSISPGKYFLLIALLGVQMIIELGRTISIFGQPFNGFISYVGLAQTLFAFLVVSVWTGGSARERRIAVIAAAIMALALIAGDLLFGTDAWETATFRILVYAIPSSIVAFFALRRLAIKLREGSSAAVILLGLVAAAFAVFLSNLAHLYIPMETAGVVGFALFVKWAFAMTTVCLFSIAFYAEARRYFAEVARGDQLERLISGRNVEIAQKTMLLSQEIEQRAILEERQRFVRDMHDGVGGQLLSLLMRVRSRTADSLDIEEELQKGLNDIRLVADSLESVGSDLNAALDAFKHRADQQLRGTQIAFEWSISDDLSGVQMDARQVLNLYRIIQEALTNCVRHSAATHFAVAIALTKAGVLSISITDDGKGISANVTEGRGFANIRKRAKHLGGKVQWSPAKGGGTLLDLAIPVA